MKVLICTDLEGCAGVVSFEEQAYPDGKYFEQAKRLATAEVNAAVTALAEAGVEDILVWDGHGPGGLVYEELHPAAKLLHGRPLAPAAVRDAVFSEYDVCMMVGQHAMAGTVDGNLNHTQSSQSVEYYKLNGKHIGEIAQFALYAGSLGLPLIFLSGDEAACREAQALIPGITTAAVKKGLSRGSAISLAPAAAQRLIREGVARALASQAQEPLAPLSWPGPYELEIRFFHTHVADAYAQRPGVQRVDALTIRVRSDNIRELIYF